jgi:hypothetical protein
MVPFAEYPGVSDSTQAGYQAAASFPMLMNLRRTCLECSRGLSGVCIRSKDMHNGEHTTSNEQGEDARLLAAVPSLADIFACIGTRLLWVA